MDSQQDRMGFDGWAENKFVNAIEDFVIEGDGKISVEGNDQTMNIWWDSHTINFSFRAYTPEGWKYYDKQIKR
jgi:hypothetical protein